MRNIYDFKVIYENEDFLAVDKPAGVLVHGAKINKTREIRFEGEFTLVDWLLSNYPEVKKVGDDVKNRPGIVHRLDKDTSGVILVPKTQDYYLFLKSLFQRHLIKKTYLAIVYGELKEDKGEISKSIGIKEGTIKRSVHSTKKAKEAITFYKVLKIFKSKNSNQSLSLLEIYPKTGRTHQIRVHLSSIGHPIMGDLLYGNKLSIAYSKELGIKRHLLHASSIEFEREPGNIIKIDSEIPNDLKTILK